MRTVKNGFIGFLVGFFLTTLLSQWLWLEMRINIGMLIPCCVILAILLGLRKRFSMNFPSVVLLQCLLFLAFLFAYNFQWAPLLVVPATLVREGLYLTSLSLKRANVLLGIVLVTGNVVWISSSTLWTPSFYWRDNIFLQDTGEGP